MRNNAKAVLAAALLAGVAAPATAAAPASKAALRAVAVRPTGPRASPIQYYGGRYYDDRYDWWYFTHPLPEFGYGYDWRYGYSPYPYGYGDYGYYGYGRYYGSYGYGAYYGYDGYGGRAEWCAWRYRSYDPASGSFLGYDGFIHYCG
jgi:hypothetical protein